MRRSKKATRIRLIADIAKARGIAKVTADAGPGRESLYKTLTPGSKPRLNTVLKLLHALGVKLNTVLKLLHALGVKLNTVPESVEPA